MAELLQGYLFIESNIKGVVIKRSFLLDFYQDLLIIFGFNYLAEAFPVAFQDVQRLVKGRRLGLD